MEKIMISLLLSTILAIFAFYKNALTKFGVIIAWILAIIITYCGGIAGFTILLSTFLGTMIAGKILHKKRYDIVQSTNQKNGKRDSIQVLANVGIGTLSLIIYYFTKNNIYFVSYACVMASSLADSLASEIGVLSKQQPIDICSLKKTTRGMSGGITWLGLLSSLLGAFIIALLFYFLKNFNIILLLFITILGFMGAIIDSILGSLAQVKYQCTSCKKITEKIYHCNKQTMYLKGIKFINNDTVNFLNNMSVFLMAILLLSNLSL